MTLAICTFLAMFILAPISFWIHFKNKNISAVIIIVSFFATPVLFFTGLIDYMPLVVPGWALLLLEMKEDIDDDDTPGCFG
ncbi:membrane protein [Bacillus phage Nachito]|nr:membrane protein [Bacillus phage Nachito]